MPGIGGGGVVNVGKAPEYYKVIDQGKTEKPSAVLNPNKFSKILDSNNLKGAMNSRVARAKEALEAQSARDKASAVPSRADIDSMIKASGLTSDQVGQLMGGGVKNKATSRNTQAIPSDKKVGTNLALKKLAKEMEVQIMGMFYTMMDNAREVNPEGGFGEQLFRGQYLTEVVKSSEDEELGEIGLAIYRNLVQDDNMKKVRHVR